MSKLTLSSYNNLPGGRFVIYTHICLNPKHFHHPTNSPPEAETRKEVINYLTKSHWQPEHRAFLHFNELFTKYAALI